MVPAVRWLIVAALALALVAAPSLLRAIPARSSTIGAVELAHRVRAAYGAGWSGEVVSQGNLRVPLTAATFSDIARLLGERTDLRVWWRTPDDWHVDRMTATGESDIAVDGGLEVTWDYESRRVRVRPSSIANSP